MDVLSVLVLAFMAGASTLLGGLVCIILKIQKRVLNFLLTSTSGVVLSVILLGLLPNALELGGVGYTALGFILGGVVLMVTGSLFPHTYGDEKYEDRLYSLLKTGTLVITGIMIYNFPAGLLLGSGFAGSQALGMMMLIAIVLQNITRGVSLNAPLMRMYMQRPFVLLLMVLAGVPALVGAGLAFAALANAAPFVLASGMAFSAGAMLFISADMLVPVVKSYARVHEIAIALFLGVFVGLLILGIG
jgi:ZIP family zinc transporter